MFRKIQTAVAAFILFLPICGSAQEEFELDTENKKYSYAVGLSVGDRLLTQFNAERGFDMQALLAGLVASVAGEDRLLSEDDVDLIVQNQQSALLAKLNQEAQEKLEVSMAFLEQNKSVEGTTVTESGLQYRVIAEGEGDSPAVTDTVLVHYRGTIMDGTVFDSSYDRGEPASFSLQSIIPGWQEALQLMKPGGKWQVVLPPNLAYGPEGAGQVIGPHEVLLFDIELLEVRKSENQSTE